MPFDGSGNFTRLFNWQSDRDNGIKILASRMDGEFDNFAAGMNQVFFRNGLIPMSGNLNVGQNYIIGLGAGSSGALSMRFADDSNSGLFLNGIGKPTLVAGGMARIEANNTGAAITGNLTVSGSFTPANGISIDPQYFLNLTSSKPTINFDTDDYLNYDRTNNILGITIGTQQRMAVNGNGIVISHPTLARTRHTTGTAAVNFDLVENGTLSYRRLSNITNVVTAYDDSDAHVFRKNDGVTEKLVLDATGNVRIGTVLGAAAGALDIQRAGTAVSNVYTRNASHSVITGVDVAGGYIGTPTNSPFSIFTSNTTRMSFDTSGNVYTSGNFGVNTSPGVRFDVAGRGRFTQDAAPTTGAVVIRQGPGDVWGGYIQFVKNDNSAETGWIGVQPDNTMRIATGSTIAMTITNTQAVLDKNGAEFGWRDVPQNGQNGAYTLQPSDRGKSVYFFTGTGALTIPDDSAGIPIGATVMLVNDSGSNRPINPAGGVTLRWMGSGATGSRTLNNNGFATLMKMQSNYWIISGVGLA